MRLTVRNIALVSSLSIAAFSCSGNKQKEELDNSKDPVINTPKDSLKAERVKKIFYVLPTPLEITLMFKKEGVEYHRDLLHTVAKRKSYSTSLAKAFNLGIYGADLSYSGLFGKHEAAIQYFAASNILADDLGLGNTFQEDFIVRLEEHAGNKDTLLQVVQEFFVQNDRQLNEQGVNHLSSCVLLGGWIEGMYLGTKIVNEKTDASAIRNILYNQREALKNLILLAQNIEKSMLTDQILEELGVIEVAYQNSDGEINEENFLLITSKIALIRNIIINLA